MKFQEAEKYYKEFTNIIQKSEEKNIKQFTLGILLIPLMCDKRMLMNQISRFEKLQRKLYVPKSQFHDILYQHFNENQGWKIGHKVDVMRGLKRQRFFQRFEQKEIEEIIQKMSIKKYSAKSYVFLQKDEVNVILQGNLVLYSHVEQTHCPKIIANYCF